MRPHFASLFAPLLAAVALASAVRAAPPAVTRDQIATPLTPFPSQASTYFSTSNAKFLSAYNAGLSVPATSAYLPGNTLNSWNLVVFFQYDASVQSWWNPTTGYQYLVSNCSAICTNGGNDHYLKIGAPWLGVMNQQNELLLYGQGGSTGQLWKPASGSAPDTGVYFTPGHNYCLVVSQYGADSGASGSMSVVAIDTATGQHTTGSPALSTGVNNASGGSFYFTGATQKTQATIGNFFNTIGTSSATTGSNQDGAPGPFSNVAMLWGVMPNTGGVPSDAAVKSLCAGGQDLKAWAHANGMTARSLYRLNDAGTWADTGDTGFANAAAIGASAPIQASPLVATSGLKLQEQGPFDVFRLDPGGTSIGTVYIRGTYDRRALGGQPSAIEARILGATSSLANWRVIQPAPSGGAFAGAIDGVPGGGPYVIEVRPANSRAQTYSARYPVYVGYSLVWLGQSQMCVLATPGSGGSGDTYAMTGPDVLASKAVNLSDAGSWKTNRPANTVGLRQITPTNKPGTSDTNSIIGDGVFQMMHAIWSATGLPVKFTMACDSGQSVDEWAFDHVTTPATNLSGSGAGPYTITAKIHSVGYNPVAGSSFGAGFIESTLKGSIRIYVGGALEATDDGNGNLVAAAGAPLTISTGAINYVTSALSVTFGSTPGSTPQVVFANATETTPGAMTQENPYIGYSMFGDGRNPASGYTTQMLWDMSGPPSAFVLEQCTSNSGEAAWNGTSAQPVAGWTSIGNKWNYVINTKFAGFSWWRPNIPVLVLGYPRDDANPFNNTAGCKGAMQYMAQHYPNFYYGGTYADNSTQGTTTGGSPHEDASLNTGGARQGRRIARQIVAVQGGAAITEPSITGAVMNGGKTQITFTISLPQGTSLSTCGATIATSGCQPAGTGASVSGFRIGDSRTSLFDEYGYDDQNIAVDASHAFSCQIAGAATVVCTRTSGTWLGGGSTWFQYIPSAPYDDFGRLTGVGVSAGGSGYTSGGPYTGGATSVGADTCTTYPTFSVTVSGGALSGAVVTNPGAGCTGPSLSVALPAGAGAGAGGALALTVNTHTTDLNDIGRTLYDNSGGFTDSHCTGAGNVCEPGFPVSPVIAPVVVN